MNPMVEIIDKLEAWRNANDLSKVAMSKVMGCNSPQQYGNWVTRNSLPNQPHKNRG